MSTTSTERKPLPDIGPSDMSEYKETLKHVRGQMVGFANEMHQYLEKIHADVENYKFTVEKHGEGIEIEVQFKAYVHPAKTVTIPK